MIDPATALALIAATTGFVAKVKQIMTDAHERQVQREKQARLQDGKLSVVEGGELALMKEQA